MVQQDNRLTQHCDKNQFPKPVPHAYSSYFFFSGYEEGGFPSSEPSFKLMFSVTVGCLRVSIDDRLTCVDSECLMLEIYVPLPVV